MEFFNGVENIHWWTVILNGGRDYVHDVDTPFSVISSDFLDERSLGPFLKSLPLDCIRNPQTCVSGIYADRFVHVSVVMYSSAQ